MNTNVITSGAKVIIRDEKSAYDGMTGKVIVSQGKGRWLVRMALDNYQFVISGNNLDIANEAQPEDEEKAESAEYTTGTKPYVLHTILYKGSTEMKLKSESRTSQHLQIEAVAELLNDETAQLRAENEALKAERDWLVANLYSNELAKYQAKFGANAHQPWQYTEPAAPTAQAASEVRSLEDIQEDLARFNREHSSWQFLSQEEAAEYRALVKEENKAIEAKRKELGMQS